MVGSGGAGPVIAIVGPTASGKTAAAIELAQRVGGEIICADSRTIYAGMDIGTAKPSTDEMCGIPHWGLDLVLPGEYFSVANFQQYCLEKIQEIRQRGAVPIIVGGTGLYVDSVLYKYDFSQRLGDIEYRERLDALSIGQLVMLCKKHGYTLPRNQTNRRHLISTIMRKGSTPIKHELESGYIVVGISTEKDILHERIALRARSMFDSNVVKEATNLAEKYGWDNEAMTGNIYPIIRRLSEGEIDIHQAVELFAISDKQLAKRQVTWFKRSKDIVWLDVGEVVTYIVQRINAGE